MDQESREEDPSFDTKTWNEMLREEQEREFQRHETKRRKLLNIRASELEEDLDDGMESA